MPTRTLPPPTESDTLASTALAGYAAIVHFNIGIGSSGLHCVKVAGIRVQHAAMGGNNKSVGRLIIEYALQSP